MADARSRWRHAQNGSGLQGHWGQVIIAIACLLMLSGCASGTTPGASRRHSATPGTLPSISASSGVLPHFSDWRAAYLAPDGRAHLVTLDGKTDLVGPALPDLTSNGLVVASAGVAADGKTLAYAAPGLDLVDLTGQTPPRSVQVHNALNDLIWSPDHTKLYSSVGGGEFFTVTLATGYATNEAPGQGVATELGWIDDTHLAAVSYQGVNYGTDGEGDTVPTSARLDSLDLTGGQARTITTIQGGGPTMFKFVLSPDGTQALYFDARFRDLAFTPRVALINLATGHVTPLPTITQATGADFTRVAWRPDSNTVAVSTGYTENGNLKTWLLDVAADSATHIAPTGYPMGWTPNNGPLVLSSGWQSGIGQGPYTLTAVSCANGAQCSMVPLTERAMDFTFLGFVRNP